MCVLFIFRNINVEIQKIQILCTGISYILYYFKRTARKLPTSVQSLFGNNLISEYRHIISDTLRFYFNSSLQVWTINTIAKNYYSCESSPIVG